jgi:hypothetical protein
MRRRDVVGLLGAALACPATARAQSGERRLKLRVGWLAVASNPFIAFFRQGMAELGHREGGDFLIEERDADGRMELLPQVAAERWSTVGSRSLSRSAALRHLPPGARRARFRLSHWRVIRSVTAWPRASPGPVAT